MFSKISVFKKFFRENYQKANCLDPDQERRSVSQSCKDFQQTTEFAAARKEIKDYLEYWNS